MAGLSTENAHVLVDHVAAQEEVIDGHQQEDENDAADPSADERPPVPCIQEEDDITSEDPALFQDDVSERFIHVSKIFRKDEPGILLGAITSIVCKMIRSTTVISFPTPFANWDIAPS